MIDAKTISDALGGKQYGKGYMACCPAHEDNDPSLHISDGDNGFPIVKCFSTSCSQESVIAALQVKGLWPKHDKPLSKQEREQLKKERKANEAVRKAEEKKRHKMAAEKARNIYETANAGEPAQHPYAVRKGINPGELAKRGPWAQRQWQDAILLPLYSADGKITSISAINVDGEKDFLAGGKMKGCFYPLGKFKGETGQIVIGEGLATVATVISVVRYPGVVALNAGNLADVAKVVRRFAPEAQIIILADDDQKPDNDRNPGIEAAHVAGQNVGGLVAVPGMNKKADAWDVWHEKGESGIRRMLFDANPPQGKNNTYSKEAVANTLDQPGFHVIDDWAEHNGEKLRPGVYLIKYRPGNKNNPDTIAKLWICSPIYVLAVTSDQQENNFGRLLRFRNTHETWREWAMPMELLAGSGDMLRAQLLSMGVEINPKTKNDLALYLQSQHPQRRAYCAIRVGWHNESFVLPNGVIGSDAKSVIFQSGDKEHDSKYAIGGTLAGWKNSIAAMSIGNHYLILAISSAFAGPLLEKTHVDGGGFHFVGDSSIGKSTAIIAACSVWSDKKFISSWKSTANGMEGAAALSNDCLLALDEIGECEAKEIGLIIYALGNGRGKQRANRLGIARTVAQWRCFVLSSGERTVETVMAEAGQRIKAGHTVRLPDVWVNQAKYGAWEDIHGAESGQAFTDQIKQAATVDYGHAGREFLKKLVKDKRNFVEVLDRIKALEGFSCDNDGQAKRVATRFALVAMAGEIATEYGITGWPEGAAIDAAAACFNTWLSMRGSQNDETKQLIEQLSGFIARHGDSLFSDADIKNADQTVKPNRAGWWRDLNDGNRIYLFNAAALRESLNGFDFKRALDILQKLDVLPKSGANGERAKAERIGGRLTKYYYINSNKLNECHVS